MGEVNRLSGFIFIILFSVNSYALDKTLELGLSNGGDALAVVTTNSNFLAGDGASLAFGARQYLTNSLSLNSSVGYKVKSGTYTQGSLRFTSYPVTFGIKNTFGKGYGVELGGIKYLKGKISGSAVPFVFSITPDHFDVHTNTGIYLELSLVTQNTLEIGLRYVGELKFLDDSNNWIKGDHGTFIVRILF